MATALPITERIVIPGEDLDVTTARSGGPGGQHVNTTDTRVRLRFSLEASGALSEPVKARLRDQCAAWLTSDGDLVVTSDSTRSQHQNLEDARQRLAEAVRRALVPPKPRRPTKPTRGSKVRRLQTKKARKDVKAGRGRVRDD
jgi:ribosome-associated protein